MSKPNYELTEREQQVVKMRSQNYPYTLEEIAKKLGVTRERVRQIEAKGMRKIRRNVGITSLA